MWFAMLGGLVILTLGAEWLVRGASRLAALAGISPLVIGLTVVAYGTSSPELAVSLKSALGGQPDVALGNAVGSNIFNVLFILGACALIQPLRVHSKLVKLDVPLMIGVSLLLLGLAYDGQLSRLDGVLLLGGAITYTAFTIITGRREGKDVQHEFEALTPASGKSKVWGAVRSALLVALGLAFLVLGSRFFVDGAVAFARQLGISELVIGLTIVAAGTSLPEVATSIVAAIRGERDIAIGNVVGSNIFNILAVLGAASIAAPIAAASHAVGVDIPVMCGVAIACLPIFFIGLEIRRWEGGLFLLHYIAYTAYIIMRSSDHHLLPAYRQVMLLFVVPLTALTLALLAMYEWRLHRRSLTRG